MREFASKHPESLAPLLRWARVVESATWKDPISVKLSLNATDFVGELTVFDIGGNKYRLIAYVHYRMGAVFIKNILTHKEHEKGAWRQ